MHETPISVPYSPHPSGTAHHVVHVLRAVADLLRLARECHNPQLRAKMLMIGARKGLPTENFKRLLDGAGNAELHNPMCLEAARAAGGAVISGGVQ